jgi:hypothetical protein
MGYKESILELIKINKNGKYKDDNGTTSCFAILARKLKVVNSEASSVISSIIREKARLHEESGEKTPNSQIEVLTHMLSFFNDEQLEYIQFEMEELTFLNL